jgi:serine/threonine protein kinase/WD40 repeat protein
MSDSDSGVNAFDALAEEFVARHRRGENPSLSEYVARHPELADDIRDLFPGLLLMEDVRPQVVDATGPFAAPPRCGPEQLGDYRILREVGRGGMGVVYEAEQLSLGRHVALKVLPTHGLMNPTFLERFRREAKAAARLHHTNIVPVFGVGEADGVYYYAMQFIQGQSLDQVLDDVRRLRRQPATRGGGPDALASVGERSMAQGLLTGQFALPTVEGERKSDSHTAVAPPPAPTGPRSSTGLSAGGSEAQYFRSVARLGLQAADALTYAHRQGVLHRDVKPSNLLLDQQGTVWITDFGLAKAEGADELTQTGDIVGTIRFMAPERFDGRSLPQSDVYSLGLTLYEMLTLRPAFHDINKARLIEKVLHDPPMPPRKIDPHLPRDLETIVLKCLSKDAAGRYATAEELADDLRRFLTDRTIRARRVGNTERLWRWCRRNPAVASLLAAVFVLLAAVAVVSTFSAVSLKWALARTNTAEREARLREAEALVGQARGIRYSHRPGQRFEALAALEKAAAIGRELDQPPEWFDRLRNEAIAALALPDVHITHEFGSFPLGSRWVELNDDFTLYVRTTDKGDCTIRRVDDDTEVARLPELGEPAEANFGSGRILAVYAPQSHRFQLWDLSGAEPALQFEVPGINYWSFRNDGRLLALAHLDGSLRVHETADGKRVHRLAPGQIVRGLLPSLHPTAPLVACCSYFHRGVQVRDLRSGAVVAAAVPPWPGGSNACWHPDGRTLLVADANNSGIIQEYAFDPAAPALRLMRNVQGQDMGGACITYNPIGDRFVSRGWSNTVHLFDAVSGRLLFSTPALPSASYVPLRFDRTGQRLAGARVGDRNDRIGLWTVAGAREHRALVYSGRGSTWGEPAIHPGGRLAAMGFTDGEALFDLDSGRELAHLPTSYRGCSICFDGAGSFLTNGVEGFFRWPVRSEAANPGRLIVGPPERLPFNPGSSHIAASHDGRVVAQSMWAGYGEAAFAGGWILHPNSPTPRRVEAGASTGVCSVSPDGRWVAFGRPHIPLTVYDAATAERVWQSPADKGDWGRFSPDGRWLVTDVDGGRLYAVGIWQPGPQLGPGAPWAVTSELAVFGQTNGIYRLVELATGRELARLEDPEQNSGSAALTPDGTSLIVAAKNGLRVWDLRRIREELVRLGLDWDAPPYAEETGGVPGPLEVKVVGAESIVQRDPTTLNNYAWQLLTGPAHQRDPTQAMTLIQDALKQQPANAHFLNTLGVAHYRNGHYAESIAALEKSLAASKGRSDAFDLFFLAMCLAKLGVPDKAKECFDRAVKWWEGKKDLHPKYIEELTRFKAEAEEVLRSK